MTYEHTARVAEPTHYAAWSDTFQSNHFDDRRPLASLPGEFVLRRVEICASPLERWKFNDHIVGSGFALLLRATASIARANCPEEAITILES